MIINIHGFSGVGNNSKYQWLCENIQYHDIYSPSLSYVNESPDSILEHLLDRVNCYLRENSDNPMGVYVVGNSMGGFFARSVNQIIPDVTSILINPSLTPFLTLREHLGDNQCRNYLNLLARYAYKDEHGNQERLHVIIGDSDELIDHEKFTKPLLPLNFRNLYTIRGGTHRLDMTPKVEDIFRAVIKTPEGMTDSNQRPIHHYGEKKLS